MKKKEAVGRPPLLNSVRRRLERQYRLWRRRWLTRTVGNRARLDHDDSAAHFVQGLVLDLLLLLFLLYVLYATHVNSFALRHKEAGLRPPLSIDAQAFTGASESAWAWETDGCAVGLGSG